MSRGVRSVISWLRSDDWEVDAPTYVYTRVAQPFAAPALRRKCGPSNPTLPITPINPNWVTLALATLVLLVSGALIDRATAQVCTVAGNPSTVTLTSGFCQIAPNTTLNGSPAVHATTSAQITTNNVNINPFNGGSTGALAETAGMITFNAGSSINGNWATAASAQTGGRIIFETGSAINPSTSGGGTALLANGTNSQISTTGLIINMNGFGGATAVNAMGGGLITLNQNTAVNFGLSGGGNTGLLASGAGSQIVTNGATLSMPGGGGGDTGVKAESGGTVTLNGGSISVPGNGGGETGLFAQSTGSTITATGVAVTVSGGGGDTGAKAVGGGAITLSGGSVSATGTGGGEIGLQASGAGSTLVASGVTVIVPNSSGGRGVQADNAGSMTLTDGTTVTTFGSGTHAAGVTGGGILTMTGGTLTANGAGSNALNVSGGNATLAGVILTSPNGASIAAPNGTSNVTLSGGSTAIVNNGQWLNVSGSSTLNLVMDSSTVQGVALTAAGSTSNVALQNNSLWTMTGNSNVSNLINGSSLIQFTPPVGDPTLLSSYKTLTAVNYTGQGGTLGLNTFLGADGSPSDRLVINGGSATGSSSLRITNAGGPGAETVANGIQVVQAINGGTSASGAFSLQGGSITAGAFDYFLFKGGVSQGSQNSWFLRSSLVAPPITPITPDTPTRAPGGGARHAAVTYSRPRRSADPALPARRRGDVSRAVRRANAWLAHTCHLQRAPGRSAPRAGWYEDRCVGPSVWPKHSRTFCTGGTAGLRWLFCGLPGRSRPVAAGEQQRPP